MRTYLDLLDDTLTHGALRPNRTGVAARSVFGRMLRYDLSVGFPILTTKRIHFKSIAEELFWFLRGETNVRSLQERGVTIWDEWADADGELGPVYGKQWRLWEQRGQSQPPALDANRSPSQGPSDGPIDQLAQVIEIIRSDPCSRRAIVSAWNPTDIPKMALAPCHVLFQLRAFEGRLSLLVFQRSADIFLGLPFNIASYALLTNLLAVLCDLEVGELVVQLGDVHLYESHLDQAHLQLSRTPRPLPQLRILQPPTQLESLEQLSFSDLRLDGYDPYASIPAPVAI